jgi:AcrR family transcriptional regulator
MSSRTPKQFEEFRKDQKKTILETALEQFAINGYESTSISMIANKAGVSKGFMYNYFVSKEELLTTILVEGLKEMVEEKRI